MDSLLLMTVMLVGLALVFDFINGFHDAANSIATIVATRVLTPLQAVAWAAFFNFISAFSFGTGVAATVGSGFVDLGQVTPFVMLASLTGAILWNLLTWWLGLPTSSSHALIGGYAGAAVARAGFGGLIVGKWPLTLAFIVAAPLIGLAVAYILMVLVLWLFRDFAPHRMDRWFRSLQLVSSAAFSYSHGTNDAQKTMGIIAAVLFAGGYQTSFHVPVWVIFAAHAAIALGTLSGGWRIVRTMGTRLTRLRPRGGFCAETGAAFAVLLATGLHLPVSTTHAITGAIAGVGTVQRVRAVRWRVAGSIVWAWVITIPATALTAWLCFRLIRLFYPGA